MKTFELMAYKPDICRRSVKESPDTWRKIRELAGISQEQVSKKLGVSPQAISQLEAGKWASEELSVAYVTCVANEIGDDELATIIPKGQISLLRELTLSPWYQPIERKAPGGPGRPIGSRRSA